MTKTILLLRGLTRESGHWGPFVMAAAKHFSSYMVHTADYPGVGEYRSVAVPWTVAGMVEAIRAQVATRPLIVIGHSLGGMVGLEWAARFPGEVRGVVCINSSAREAGHWRDRFQALGHGRLVKIFKARGDREREEAILRLVSRTPERHADILNLWTKIARERRPSRLTFARQLAAAARYRVPKLDPALPILCIGSLGDELVNPSCSQELAKRLGAELKMHGWAGHEVTLDDPQWVLTEVQKWLDRHQL